MSEWVSVDDKLPDEDENVLAGNYPFGIIHINRLIDKKNSKWLYGSITHWMPLPEPPKEDGAE